MASLQQRLADVKEYVDARPQQAIADLKDIALGQHPNDTESIKIKEQAIQLLADTLAKQQDAAALRQLLTDLRVLFAAIPKAKTAKLVRNVIDAIAKVPNSTALQVMPGVVICVALCIVHTHHTVGGVQGAGAVGQG